MSRHIPAGFASFDWNGDSDSVNYVGSGERFARSSRIRGLDRSLNIFFGFRRGQAVASAYYDPT